LAESFNGKIIIRKKIRGFLSQRTQRRGKRMTESFNDKIILTTKSFKKKFSHIEHIGAQRRYIAVHDVILL
jgi:hypothetical protein